MSQIWLDEQPRSVYLQLPEHGGENVQRRRQNNVSFEGQASRVCVQVSADGSLYWSFNLCHSILWSKAVHKSDQGNEEKHHHPQLLLLCRHYRLSDHRGQAHRMLQESKEERPEGEGVLKKCDTSQLISLIVLPRHHFVNFRK